MAFKLLTTTTGKQEGCDEINGRFDKDIGHTHDGTDFNGGKIKASSLDMTTVLSGALHQAAPVELTSSSGVLTLTEASNSFVVSGTEAISSITGWSAGIAVIRWNTIRTLTNSTSLILQGSANRTTAVGDVGIYEITTVSAREIGYFPVMSSVVYANVGGSSSQKFKVADATSSDEAVALGQFSSSLAANGYQKFPNGLIVQWGTGMYVDAAAITFPIAFPNACLNVSVTQAGAGSYTSGAYNLGKTGFNVTNRISYTGAACTITINWRAIGY